MLVTAQSLDALRTAFRNDFQKGLIGWPTQWEQIATRVPSSGESNTYGWLDDWPRLREWIGDRVVKSLSENGYTLKNRPFEGTVGVKRTKIEDDTFGIYGPMMESMGQSAAEFPDELIFSLLATGFDKECHDGQNFFDDEHPLGDGSTWSNVQAGAAEPWFLLDTRRPLKPLIWQDRKKPEFVSMTKIDDEAVFMAGEYRYGVDMRGEAGFSFPQLAFGSEATLTPENYAAGFENMTSRTNDDGRKLNVRPNLLVHGPNNRAAAKRLIKAMTVNGGDSNIYFEDVELLECPWIN